MGFASQVWRGMLCSNCNVEQFCGNPSKPTYDLIKSIVDKVMVRFFYDISTHDEFTGYYLYKWKIDI